MNVAGRFAIVTDGGDGIGGAIADELAAHGARVLVADLDAASAHALTDKINAASPGSALAAGADVSDTAAIGGLIALAGRQFGPPHAPRPGVVAQRHSMTTYPSPPIRSSHVPV